VAIDAQTNAVPITYRAKNENQYVAVQAAGVPAAGATPGQWGLRVFSLP
jgi:hypothetical protein